MPFTTKEIFQIFGKTSQSESSMAPPKLNIKPSVLSSPVLVMFDVIVGAMKAIAPMSAALVVFRIWAYLTGRRKSLLFSRTTLAKRILNLWLVCEALFFLYCQHVGYKVQAQPDDTKIVKLTKEERRTLFERCLQTISSPQEFAETWYRTDHSFKDLKRGNIVEWLGWGLFHKHNVEKEMDKNELVELEEMVEMFETSCLPREEPGWKLPPGYNNEALLMKFSEEPVTHTHRPLVMYTAVHFILQELITPIYLARLGFTRGQFNTLSYQFRAGSDPSKEPLVFIHGLGVGILPYEQFLRDFIVKVEDASSPMYGRAILCVELHAVSQRLLPPELHRDDFVTDMEGIMQQFGFQNGGIIMGHSYGSFATAWLVHRAPKLVSGLALLDPACMFLHYPNVLFSILYKSPQNAHERFMHYLIREELFFNAHARRHFFWYANVLFLEDVDTSKTPTLVVLSEDDFIVPIRPALKYVQEYNGGKRLSGKHSADINENGKVDLVFLKECDHGGFLWMKDHRKTVVSGIEKMVSKLKKP